MPNRNFAQFVDTDPEPVDEIPAPQPFKSEGRNRTPEFVALQSKLMLKPGVDHKLAAFDVRSRKAKENARIVANGLRGTLKRYGIKVTERTLNGQLTIYGRYENGTTPE